jgi:putative membrane protein
MSAPLARSATLRYPAVLLILFVMVWLALAIHPWYRQDWLLENVLVLVALPLLVIHARRMRLSALAWTALFAFGVLHEVGAHYTYAQVPWRQWFDVATAGAGRNAYDRLVHFSYGLLLMPAIGELIDRRLRPDLFWRWMLPVSFIALHSMIYELFEWAAAMLFGGDLGQAYLGTQGDVWDAQGDMAMALLGAALGRTAVMLWQHHRREARAPAGAPPGEGPRDPVRD